MQRLVIGLTLCLGIAAMAHAQNPGKSHAHGASLETWMLEYFTWYYQGADEEANGDRNVQFLPLPAGEQTDDDPLTFVGEESVALEPGDAFAVPLFVWVGERYEGYPDVPDDPLDILQDEDFLNATVQITLDGNTIIDSADEDLSKYFFGPAFFEEPVFYEEPTNYGAVAAVWVKGLGMVHHPLEPGEHTLHLFVYSPVLNLIFDNTWSITVE